MNTGFYLKSSVAIAKGLATFVPGVYDLFSRKKTGGTNTAEYSYSVWMKHLVMLRQSGLNDNPQVVAELGPGDSLGIGLCAMLTGASQYRAFDAVSYAYPERNLKIFRELVNLFRKKSDISFPGESLKAETVVWPRQFPEHILTPERLAYCLMPERIKALEAALTRLPEESEKGERAISYLAPWNKSKVMENSIDLVFSQSVLEHVEDLEGTYAALYRWLKPGGVMSHEIDFRSHEITSEWNGHWVYDEWLWKIIKGRRPFLLNRFPCSEHRKLLHRNGFKIIKEIRNVRLSDISRQDISDRFSYFEEEDLTTAAVFFQAVKE